MSLGHIATEGFLNGSVALVATEGFLGDGAGPVIPPEEPPSTGGDSHLKPKRDYFWYKHKFRDRTNDDRELDRMIRIRMEDDEISEFIMMLLTKGLM